MDDHTIFLITLAVCAVTAIHPLANILTRVHKGVVKISVFLIEMDNKSARHAEMRQAFMYLSRHKTHRPWKHVVVSLALTVMMAIENEANPHLHKEVKKNFVVAQIESKREIEEAVV